MEETTKQKRHLTRREFLKSTLDDYQSRDPEDHRVALLIDTMEDVIDSIERASDSADKLSRGIFWLTLALAVLGVLGLLVAGYGVFFK